MMKADTFALNDEARAQWRRLLSPVRARTDQEQEIEENLASGFGLALKNGLENAKADWLVQWSGSQIHLSKGDKFAVITIRLRGDNPEFAAVGGAESSKTDLS